jgi:hypothetical protein
MSVKASTFFSFDLLHNRDDGWRMERLALEKAAQALSLH